MFSEHSSGRRIRSIEDYRSLNESARAARSRALDALAIARREGRELEWAAGEAGTTMAIVRAWVGDALRKPRRGKTFPNRSDSIPRLRPLFVEGQLDFVLADGSDEADKAERILDDQYGFLEGRAGRDRVERHAGKTIGGRLVEADPNVLIALGDSGEADIPETYRDLIG